MQADFSHILSGGRAAFPALLEAIETYLRGRGVPDSVAGSVLIAFDEIISNILDYGGAAADPRIEVEIAVRDGKVSATVVDDGIAFDPGAVAAPDIDLPLDERPIGGLGIYLVRKLMDGVDYDRSDGQNRLRFHKDFPLENS